MGKKSKKTKRKSELKIIFFIILIAAALFIVSTYAWFSTQRNILITNLNGKVQVAEGLEVSLNAENWSNEIVLGSGEGKYSIEEVGEFGAYKGHRNLMPEELLPVSTLGKVETDTMVDLQLLRGKITNSIQLSNITETLHAKSDTVDREDMEFAGHIAFDMFLKNSSRMDVDMDDLQLNYDSSVHIMASEDGEDKSGTGLMNTVRVAFAKFGGAEKDKSGKYTGVAPIEEDDKDEILILTGAAGTDDKDPDDVYITDVAIWEPNAADHVEYIVKNNNKLTWSETLNPEMFEVVDKVKQQKKFTTTTQMPTYALTSAAKTEGTTIKDVYDWDGETVNLEGVKHSPAVLAKQITLQTNKKSESDYTIVEGVQNLISTTAPNTEEETLKDGDYNFSIPANSICRIRVYVWLEGQDVDCINWASHGGGVTVNLGLVKGSVPGTSGAESEPTE